MDGICSSGVEIGEERGGYRYEKDVTLSLLRNLFSTTVIGEPKRQREVSECCHGLFTLTQYRKNDEN